MPSLRATRPDLGQLKSSLNSEGVRINPFLKRLILVMSTLSDTTSNAIQVVK